jgi:hypothetical protein
MKFKVFTVAGIMLTVFWDVMQPSLWTDTNVLAEPAASTFIFSYPEEQNNRFINNTGFYLQNYVMSHTKRLYY